MIPPRVGIVRRGQSGGNRMRKSAMLLAVIMVAAAPATALAAKKAKAPADPNAAGKKFVTAAWQQPGHILKGMVTPWWVAKK